MGSFFLTSKKASATLVFLVISILVVSSGVIITNQIKKSNEDNVAGTGLVLLDNEQDSLGALSDSSDSGTKLFTFGDSEGRIFSKKSSGGGGGGSSKNSQTYNEPETLDNDEIVDDQTFENQTETNYTGEIKESEIEDDFSNSSREIFSRNGTTYIMRGGEEYILSTSSSTYYIQFNPPLPSSVCENEKIDITVKGEGRFYPDAGDVVYYGFHGYANVFWCIDLMEDDGVFLPDDLVAFDCGSSKSYDLESFYFEEDLLGVDLSDWIIPDPGGNGEFYVKIYDFDSKVGQMSTSSYDVYGYVNDECKCFSGPCCDLSSRPYIYKSYPSQPTGYTDYYYCSGTNSPTGTNYCKFRNYYCSGTSSDYSYSNSIKDTCGTCEYCTTGDPTCNYYSNGEFCGTKDCDYLDTACRDYHDMPGKCLKADGQCYFQGCIDYTNKPKHTSCGTNMECDGSGTCVTCTSHSYTGCWYDDVYYYDACGNREEKKDECGNSYCGDWYRDTCHGDDAYETQLCYDKGCTTTASFGVHCYSNKYENERFVETCQYGCINGNCKPNPDIACFSNRDCGQNGLTGNLHCYDNDVYDSFREYTCNNPGTKQSFCSSKDYPYMIEDCGEDFYSDSYCYDDDVYQNFTDRGCLDGTCFENTTAQFIQECGEGGCSNGECLYVECYNDTMCGPDDDYVGDPFCQDGSVWQNHVTYTCNYPGTGNSYCSNSTAPKLREDCGSDYCENWGSNYCNLDDLYHERTCHDKGCSGGACFDDTYTEEEKVQDCGISEYTGNNYCYNDDVYRDYITRGCSDSTCTSSASKKKIEDCTNECIDGRCKIEVCKIVCNFGICYEYCIWQ